MDGPLQHSRKPTAADLRTTSIRVIQHQAFPSDG